MVCREPESQDVIAQLQKREFVVRLGPGQSLLLYIPKAIAEKVTRGQIYGSVVANYQTALAKHPLGVMQYENSLALQLPPADVVPDPRLESLKAAILADFDRSGREPKVEAPVVEVRPAKLKRRRKPEPDAAPPEVAPEPAKPAKQRKPYVFQIPRPPKEEPVILEEEDEEDDFVLLSLESFSAKFYPAKTEFFIPPRCILEVGRHDIGILAKTIYNANTLKRLEMPRWEKKDSGMALVLPPTWPHCGRFTDPRVERLKRLIIDACVKHRQ